MSQVHECPGTDISIGRSQAGPRFWREVKTGERGGSDAPVALVVGAMTSDFAPARLEAGDGTT